MRKQGIEFKGIIRATSGQAPGEGAMEELINLRNDAGSLKPIRDKKTLIDNVYYDKIYLHRYSSTENYIGVAGNEVRWLGIDGVTKQIVCTCNSGDINITSTGSLIVVCCMDEQSLRVYNFKGTYYFAHYLSLPPAVRVGVTTESNPQQSAMVARAGALPSLRELTELCVSMLQECRLKEPKASEGYILVSANYTLLDGSETKMTPPKLIQLGSYNQAMQFAVPGTDTSKFYATVPCQKLKLTAITPGTLAAYRDIIRSVNLYCSTPISAIDLDPMAGIRGWTIIPGSSDLSEAAANAIYMPRKTFRGELFDNILLYKQAEFALDQTTKSVEIVFQNIEGGKTMPVDSSGWIATVGKPFMYNNRLHLFDIKRTVIVDESVFSQFSAGQSSVDDPTEPPPTPPPTDAPYTDPPDTEQPSHQIAPSVSTISLSNLRTTAIYATAYLGSTGNSPILEKGFVYSTYNSTPTVTNGTKRIISGASSVGYYYGDAFGLEPDTLYYIRAYAVNAIGIAYGSALSARTTQAPITEEPITNDPITDEPITTEEETTDEETTDEETTQEVTTELPPSYIFVEHYGYSAISPQDAYNQGMGGNIYKDSTTQCYYNDWGTNVAPDGWYLTSYGATFGGSAWMKLEGGYIVATQDTSDETTQEQTTELATTQPPPQPPVVTTISVGSITTVSAVVNSSVTSTKPLIQKGICVSLYQNPTITDMAFQAANTATGAYQVSATGLTPMATYYVRAYAINADGITYGGQLSFETEEEATTEPVPQYLFVEHYGFATDSAQEAWESGMGGNLYLNTTTQRYYDDTGENVAVNGYYITYFGDTFESSEHIQLIGGYQQQ